MPDYLFADGPFAGQVLGTREVHVEGDLMAVEVVDVELAIDALDRPVTHDYRVETAAADQLPGLLKHLGPDRPQERLAG